MKPRPSKPSRSRPRAEPPLRRLATLLAVEPAFLERCVEFGAVRLEDLRGGPPDLAASRLARLRRLHRICRGLDIDVFAACLIIDLLERMDGLRREVERLRLLTENRPADFLLGPPPC